MIRKQLVAVIVATMILAPLQVVAESYSGRGESGIRASSVIWTLSGAASIVGGVVVLATTPARSSGWFDFGTALKRTGAGLLIISGSIGFVFGLIGIIANHPGRVGAHGGCLSLCEEQARTCRNRALWHRPNADPFSTACERPQRACRRKCNAKRRKSKAVPSPASASSTQPTSAPTTKPTMQPSTPPSAVDEPGLHVSLAPFVAPTPSGDTRYGLAVVGRF